MVQLGDEEESLLVKMDNWDNTIMWVAQYCGNNSFKSQCRRLIYFCSLCIYIAYGRLEMKTYFCKNQFQLHVEITGSIQKLLKESTVSNSGFPFSPTNVQNVEDRMELTGILIVCFLKRDFLIKDYF